ncbi:LacI family DNA-binding transcriptional regulator [Pantoea sp. B65]|uniref:LacI family DNA-binding transcriptional regulator n=1 Tax=Pantoea sp. B65 TaxID=2813359 RepID=UPI0039B3E665
MKFSIKQIAAQSGVSKATVDRALHQRGSVHPQTERRIAQGIRDLELQHRVSLASGRTLPIDIVLHTPERFSQLVTEALLSQISSFAPFRLALRFHIFEQISVSGLQRLLLRCSADSYGVLLKASDEVPLNQAVAELLKLRVPVVTLVTDLPHSMRIRYVGMENHNAGRTAAYLLARWLEPAPQSVAVVLSSDGFRGEEQRVDGFCEALQQLAPQLRVRRVSGGYGVNQLTLPQIEQALVQHQDIHAVYSVGGANTAIIDAFNQAQRRLKVFIAHDLDAENRQLLRQGKLDAVIDHDLRQDARSAFQAILQFHGFLAPEEEPGHFSRVNVVTPYNV